MSGREFVGAVLSLWALTSACASDPNEPGTGLVTLAYQGTSGVELTDVEGTVHRTLVPDAAPLAWSPDGKLLAVRKGEGVWLASLADDRVSEFVPSTEWGGFAASTWSPNGRELLLERFGTFSAHSCPTDLARYSLDQSYPPQAVYRAPSRIVCWGGGAKGFTWADWSPDGSHVVVHDWYQVYVVSRDGMTERLLTEGRQPDWSPDGSAIVYVAGPLRDLCPYGPDATLHLISTNGSNDLELTDPAANETDAAPAWSPDGSKIAFVRHGLAPDSTITWAHAYIVDRDGSNEHQLAVLPSGNLLHPTWSPDGLHLAYSGHAGTYVVNADGSGFRRVSDARAYTPAQWRP
jgi:dipeptidyl aminopeptidase/acylaminoacyl peptidase